MTYIRLGERDGYIAVRVCRVVVSQVKRGVIHGQGHLGRKDLGGDGGERRGGKGEIPIRDTLNCLEMLMCVRVRDNRRTFLGQPKVPIRVVEVPMRIDEARDRIAAEAVGGLQDAGPRAGYSCVEATSVSSRAPGAISRS